MHIFIAAAHPRPRAVSQRGQLEIHVRDDLARPFRVTDEHLLPCAGGPVKAVIGYAPFLGGHAAENQRIFRLIPAQHQCPGNAQHHGNGGVVILKAAEIAVIVGGEEDHPLRMTAGNLTDDVVGGLVAGNAGVRVQLHGKRTVRHQRTKLHSVPPGNGEGWRVLRAADILRVERFLVYLAIAAALYGDQRPCSHQMRLIHGIADPPLIPLVDIHQHQLSAHVPALVVRGGALAQIDQLHGLKAVRYQLGLIRAQLHLTPAAHGVCIS